MWLAKLACPKGTASLAWCDGVTKGLTDLGSQTPSDVLNLAYLCLCVCVRVCFCFCFCVCVFVSVCVCQSFLGDDWGISMHVLWRSRTSSNVGNLWIVLLNCQTGSNTRKFRSRKPSAKQCWDEKRFNFNIIQQVHFQHAMTGRTWFSADTIQRQNIWRYLQLRWTVEFVRSGVLPHLSMFSKLWLSKLSMHVRVLQEFAADTPNLIH